MSDANEDLSAPPQWMIELENKLKTIKETRQLGHEFGAGSRCLTCKEKCPGLELHFWRKICISCKCKKEAHDIPPEDGNVRFEILLNKDGTKGYKSSAKVLDIALQRPEMNNVVLRQFAKSYSPMPTRTLKLDWTPPDSSDELAREYMIQLPSMKVPVSGTKGARYRKLQIEKQIPLHDISPVTCQKLDPEAQKKFLEYLQNLRDNVVGQARIQKVCQIKFLENSELYTSLPQPQCSGSIQGKKSKEEPVKDVSEELNNLNLSLFQVTSYKKPTMEETPLNVVDENLHIPTTSLKLPSSFINVNLPVMKGSDLQTTPDTRGNKPGNDNETLDIGRADDNSMIKDTPNLCNDTETRTDLINEPATKHDDSKIENSNPLNVDCKLDNNNSLNADSKINNSNPINTDVKIDNSNPLNPDSDTGEKYDVNYQCGFDSHPQGYKALPGQFEKESAEKESTIVRDQDVQSSDQSEAGNLGQMLPVEKPLNCARCEKEIEFGSVAVVTDRAGPEVVWHPNCFTCNICQELLVDLIYFFHEGKVYCGRHYAEKLKVPRCHACDELIFVLSYTIAEERAYHVEHFCCAECDIALGGMSYVDFNDHPVCLSCYETNHAKKCHTCKNPIRAVQRGIKLNDFDWHDEPDCFKCGACKKSLKGSKFLFSRGNVFCHKECITTFINNFNDLPVKQTDDDPVM